MNNFLRKEIEIPSNHISARRKVLQKDFPLHWHDFFEIEYIVSGSGKYIIDNDTYDIAPGMIFFTTPTSFHHLHIPRDITIYTIMFTMTACTQKLLNTLCLNSSYTVLHADEKARIFFEAVLDELVTNPEKKTYTSCMLDSIISKIINESDPHSKKPISVVNQVQLYIINNFRSEITLDTIAKFSSFTPTYFSHKFKEEAGINFKEYLNNMRYEYAQKLLKYSNMNILQICGECGFNDYTNFVRRFKLRFGMSPTQFRKKFHATDKQ